MNQEINWSAVVEIARSSNCQTRLKVAGWNQSAWSATILIPSPKCIELPMLGPVAMDQVEYLDILVRFQKVEGKYAKPENIDVGETVAEKLRQSGVSFQFVEKNDVVRVEAN